MFPEARRKLRPVVPKHRPPQEDKEMTDS